MSASRALQAATAACAAVAGLWLALHHPLGGTTAAALLLVTAAAVLARPMSWLIVLPGLLPVLALAPWSGLLGVEEIDLLVLAVATGGYARLAWRPAASATPTAARAASVSALVLLMLLLFAVATLVSLARGVADAGGWPLLWRSGWYQGLREPLASVRLAKPLFAALLLWPLWLHAQRQAPADSAARLSAGLALGLVTASLAALWERLAFTGLLNFSTDYRTTALFWEMQVGGAAFDGFLALTVPFALRELLVARSHARWLVAAGALALAAYACLTTFSRGVYLGVPLGLVVMATIEHLRARRNGAPSMPARERWTGGVLVIAFAGVAFWIFPNMGYRGLLACFGAFAVLLALGPVLADLPRRHWLAGLALGVVLSGLAAACGALLPKGAYVAFALTVGFTLAMIVARHRTETGALALAGFLSVVTSVALIARHWGGDVAWERSLPAIALMLAGAVAPTLAARSGVPSLWPNRVRWQGGALAAMALAGSVVGVLSGGAYMTGRFSTSSDDLHGREHHWRDGMALLSEPLQWAFGLGLGRFPAHYALAAPEGMRPGDYRLVHAPEGNVLALASGTHVNGWGEIFRVSQRVSPPEGATEVEVSVRSAQATTLHFDLCEKHLLYNGACQVGKVTTQAQAGEWQVLKAALKGPAPSRGPGYAPRLIAFSVGVESPGHRVDIRRLSLVDSRAEPLLANGDFKEGLAHWFSSSDRHHLPWHAKNMGLHVLIDQGLIGVVLLSALIAGGLWRTVAGQARDHPLAPALAGGLVGFIAVGLTDSLIDAPRIALLFNLLLLIALTLRGVTANGGRPR